MAAKLLSPKSVVIVAAGMCLAVSGPLWAKMFKYTDENGNIHVVDDFDKVPAKYRSGTKIRPSTVGSEPAPPPAADKDKPAEGDKPADGAAAPADGKEAGKEAGKDGDKKKGPVDKNGNDESYWRTRLDRCSQDSANLASRLSQLESSAGSGNDPGSAEVARQIQETQQKLDAKKRECSSLRDDGRKAGAPAGWLR